MLVACKRQQLLCSCSGMVKVYITLPIEGACVAGCAQLAVADCMLVLPSRVTVLTAGTRLCSRRARGAAAAAAAPTPHGTLTAWTASTCTTATAAVPAAAAAAQVRVQVRAHCDQPLPGRPPMAARLQLFATLAQRLSLCRQQMAAAASGMAATVPAVTAAMVPKASGLLGCCRSCSDVGGRRSVVLNHGEAGGAVYTAPTGCCERSWDRVCACKRCVYC